MGSGMIVAALVSITAILIAAYVFTTGGFYMVDTLTESFKEMQDTNNELLKTEINIGSIIVSGQNINVTLNNTGYEKIREFSRMDVIMHYYTPGGGPEGTMKIISIPYTDQGTPNEDEWTVTRILPTVINPGIFDPDEEMTIWIKMSSGDPVMEESMNNWLQITTPNGISASKYFNG
jgi:flagellar protein FlaF